MSAWPWIAGIEAVAATGVAIESILRADRWKGRALRWRRRAAQRKGIAASWREESRRLRKALAAERETRLFDNHLHRRPEPVGAQETLPSG